MKYRDYGGSTVFVIDKDKNFEVFHDSSFENREYICIDDNIVYLEDMEEINGQ
ncbi:MAG: hypothetical protein ACRC7S_07495 [Cetobacterium sp.]